MGDQSEPRIEVGFEERQTTKEENDGKRAAITTRNPKTTARD
jgi:hypothetical protein